MTNQIAFVKTGWSDYYCGGPVYGRHKHIEKFDEAYECLNFLPSKQGNWYAYIPPIGKDKRPPQPSKNEDWLVVFVAARNGDGPLTIVGWYKKAKFEPGYLERPKLKNETVPLAPNGKSYLYCIHSKNAYLIEPEDRNTEISGEHFRRAPIIYVSGNGKNEPWRKELSDLALEITYEKRFDKQSRKKSIDAEHNQKIEKGAIETIIKLYQDKGYKIEDKQKLNCGYDLLAYKNTEQLHLEVKGASSDKERFFISRKEWDYSLNPCWRLCIVTSVLKSPNVKAYTRKQIERKFIMKPMTYNVTPKS